jgi:dihydroxyacetone kinase DhaKLM complex PTS-EIIA-like component DhaM
MRRPIRSLVAAVLVPFALTGCGGGDDATDAPTTIAAGDGTASASTDPGAFPESNNPTIDTATIHVVVDAAAEERTALVAALVDEGTALGATVVVTEVDLVEGTPSAAATDAVGAAIDAGAEALLLVGVSGEDLADGLTPAVAARLAVFAVDGEPETGVSSVLRIGAGLEPREATVEVLDVLAAYFSGTIPDQVVTLGA